MVMMVIAVIVVSIVHICIHIVNTQKCMDSGFSAEC